MKEQKRLTILSKEERALYKTFLVKWDKKLKPLTDSARAAQIINKEDLNIYFCNVR